MSAALAAGSMSAHAVIQAVPAPAVLIPLFVSADQSNPNSTGARMTVRVQVANSVGVDAIVQLFAPATGGGLSQQAVQTGLSTSAPNGSTPPTSKLHWYFMSTTSNEILNSAFPVSANDVLEFTSNNMPTANAAPAVSCTTPVGGIQTDCTPNGIDLAPSGTTGQSGYLVIVNESANTGGAPNIAFTADAFMTLPSVNPRDGTAPNVLLVNNIPVIPLSDAADGSAQAPTLANNVLELFGNVPDGSPYANPITGDINGPVVSPMISGIRIGFADNGEVADTYRVIDFPINGGNAAIGEHFVVWSDRNESLNILGSAIAPVPAIRGNIFQFDCDETQRSAGTLSITRQLTFVNFNPTGVLPPFQNPYSGIQEDWHYVNSGASSDVAQVDHYAESVRNINLSGGITAGKCSTGGYQISGTQLLTTSLNQGGLVRWFAEPNKYNVGGLQAGTFQAGVIFRLKSNNQDGYGQFPTDNGSFLGL